jgi:hypothetical protein
LTGARIGATLIAIGKTMPQKIIHNFGEPLAKAEAGIKNIGAAGMLLKKQDK